MDLELFKGKTVFFCCKTLQEFRDFTKNYPEDAGLSGAWYHSNHYFSLRDSERWEEEGFSVDAFIVFPSYVYKDSLQRFAKDYIEI